MTSPGYQTTVAECTSALKLGFRFRVYGLGLRVSKRLRLFRGLVGLLLLCFWLCLSCFRRTSQVFVANLACSLEAQTRWWFRTFFIFACL